MLPKAHGRAPYLLTIAACIFVGGTGIENGRKLERVGSPGLTGLNGLATLAPPSGADPRQQNGSGSVPGARRDADTRYVSPTTGVVEPGDFAPGSPRAHDFGLASSYS